MSYLDDPRVFFAAERTLLAWVRSGITIMALGVVVAKFGLFLHLLTMTEKAAPMLGRERTALGVGLFLVLLGSASCVAAAVQFRRFTRSLAGAEVPPRWILSMPGLFAWSSALAGVLVGLYLLV